MDKRTSLLELLAEVEPKVAKQNDRLTAQYVAISRLAERGQDIAEALSVLSQIKELRNALERYRDQSLVPITASRMCVHDTAKRALAEAPRARRLPGIDPST